MKPDTQKPCLRQYFVTLNLADGQQVSQTKKLLSLGDVHRRTHSEAVLAFQAHSERRGLNMSPATLPFCVTWK
jgi:hypothetical protein